MTNRADRVYDVNIRRLALLVLPIWLRRPLAGPGVEPVVQRAPEAAHLAVVPEPVERRGPARPQLLQQAPQRADSRGEYTNMALVDRLQSVGGVRIAELRASTSRAANEDTTTQIDARMTPAAGYFKPGEITVNMKAYDEQG